MGEFTALSKEEANAFNSYPDSECESVRVIENGEVVLKIQALMKYGKSYAILTYTVPKTFGYIEIHIKMLTDDVNTTFKLQFDTTLDKDADFIDQKMFSRGKCTKVKKRQYIRSGASCLRIVKVSLR